MSGEFLVNASREGLSPLGTAPQRSFELISGTLSARLGPAHAALFAEPVASAQGERADWYATLPGRPRPLADLPEAEEARARAELARLSADIRALAAELAAGGGEEQRLGEALSNALEIPGEEAIYVLDGLPDGRLQPVLVNWACAREARAPVRGALSGADTRARPALPPPLLSDVTPDLAPAAGPAPGQGALLRWLLWLGWLLLAAMIAALLYLMLEACALRLPGAPGNCPAPAEASLAERERMVLENRLRALERRIAAADRACQPAPDTRAELPPLLPPPPAAAPSEAEERMRDSGARLGELTFTLIWDGPDDIDLHVTCPAGQTISYRAKQACGGALDVDSNARALTPRPIENIYFDAPPPGAYRIAVNAYESRTGGASRPFELRISDADGVQTLRGEVSPARPTWETTYQTGER